MEHERVKMMKKVIWYKINVRYPCAIFTKTSKDDMVDLGYDIIKGTKKTVSL